MLLRCKAEHLLPLRYRSQHHQSRRRVPARCAIPQQSRVQASIAQQSRAASIGRRALAGQPLALPVRTCGLMRHAVCVRLSTCARLRRLIGDTRESPPSAGRCVACVLRARSVFICWVTGVAGQGESRALGRGVRSVGWLACPRLKTVAAPHVSWSPLRSLCEVASAALSRHTLGRCDDRLSLGTVGLSFDGSADY